MSTFASQFVTPSLRSKCPPSASWPACLFKRDARTRSSAGFRVKRDRERDDKSTRDKAQRARSKIRSKQTRQSQHLLLHFFAGRGADGVADVTAATLRGTAWKKTSGQVQLSGGRKARRNESLDGFIHRERMICSELCHVSRRRRRIGVSRTGSFDGIDCARNRFLKRRIIRERSLNIPCRLLCSGARENRAS